MTKKQINNILIWMSAILLIILIMTPGLWVVITAFRPQVDIMAKPAVWIPRNLSLINLKQCYLVALKGQWEEVKFQF